jgi:pyridoxamine 5'-phosphate oxidase family protein
MESEPKASRRRDPAGYFREEEAAFLAEGFIGRVATVSPSGQPHVVPVAYKFDGKTIAFGGWNLEKSLKFRNMMSNQKVAFVVDEIVSTRPWRVKGLEVRGRAEPIHGSEGVTGVRIIPVNIRSWGLEG